MDWSKVDAGLAVALGDDRSVRYVVFVHLTSGADPEALAELGVQAGPGLIQTATVSAGQVERLTDLSWVTHLRLSRLLGPTDPP